MFRRPKLTEHPLVVAWDQALASGAAGRVLEDLEFSIRKEADARAVIHVLRTVAALAEELLVQWIDRAVGLLDHIESSNPRCVRILLQEAVPCLLQMEERLRDSPADNHGHAWSRVMRGLVTTCTQEGGRRLIRAIRDNRHPDHWQWRFIFAALRESTVQRDMLFAAVQESLPPSAFLPLLLQLGKATCLEDASVRHPLDQPPARDWFEKWILESATDSSTAVDAAVSLAFLRQPWAADLTGCALRHPLRQVRMEAAWSAARQGDERGAALLAQECLDFRVSGRARAYLEELGRPDLIPPASADPEFMLKGGLSRWVENPDGGFHTPPEEIETVYQTEARWPGLTQSATLYVMRYRVKDRWGVRPDGIGFGGGASVEPEDAWATELTGTEHAALEDMAAGSVYGLLKTGIGEEHSFELEGFSGLLAHWQGRPLENAELQHVLVVDPPLSGLPGTVAIAEAEIAGSRGWAVIECPPGPDGGSLWYDASLRPAGTLSGEILAEHAGRRLLGWKIQPEKSNIVRVPEMPGIPAEEFVANFEQMVTVAVTAGAELRDELMSPHGGWKIPRSLDRYHRELLATGQTDRFLRTAGQFMPLIDDAETAARLTIQLSSCGHQEPARALLARVLSGELTGAEDALLARARHATSDPSAADSLREPMQQAADEYTAGHSEWKRWQKDYSRENYGELVSALRECTGSSFAATLAAWNLPESL